MTILILGGTGAARVLADRLVSAGVDVVTSLAGRTRDARFPTGDIRVGGFGGADGLARYLSQHEISGVINATHPFADQMSAHAVTATDATGIPLLRLSRASWREHPHADSWVWVANHAEAAHEAAHIQGRILLTVGRQNNGEYAEALAGRDVICRVANAHDLELPPSWRIIAARGPFTLDDEYALLETVSCLVSKDSGGQAMAAKLDAAAARGVRVIMIARPAEHAREIVTRVDDAITWALSLGA